MIKGKTHLTLSERKQIELGPGKRLSLGQIARSLDKSTSTVLREIRKHTAQVQSGSYSRPFNCCRHRNKYDHRNLCDLSLANKSIYARNEFYISTVLRLPLWLFFPCFKLITTLLHLL